MPDNFDAARVAEAIVRLWCDDFSTLSYAPNPENQGSGQMEMEREIAAALLDARKAPPGHVIDENGVVRKVLGTLPITADGCVVGAGARPFVGIHEWGSADQADDICIRSTDGPLNGMAQAFFGGPYSEWVELSECYSTREAAEAAKETA